jgi:hypothetical protein
LSLHLSAGSASNVRRAVQVSSLGPRWRDARIYFESDEQNAPETVTKERIAEIAANFMTVFYRIQVGALETQELRTAAIPYWLVAFSDTVKGPIHQLFFAVVLPDGRVVAPRVAERM